MGLGNGRINFLFVETKIQTERLGKYSKPFHWYCWIPSHLKYISFAGVHTRAEIGSECMIFLSVMTRTNGLPCHTKESIL